MKFKKTKDILNQLVADLTQLSLVIHQIHWYVKGNGFFNIHLKMDDYMKDINIQLDVIAERLITIGGYPFSTLNEIIKYTNIINEKGSFEISINKRLCKLLEDFKYISELYKTGIEVTSFEKDNCTQDILINFKIEIEKKIWMLSSELKY